MNRAQLRQLAQDRILDAAALLAAGWSGAYYLTGYAAECGLKACIMAHVEASGVIFTEKNFSEKCWTHNLAVLVKQADLKATLDAELAVNAAFALNWGVVNAWEETSRYQQTTQVKAQQLYDAMTVIPNGVFQWIQNHW